VTVQVYLHLLYFVCIAGGSAAFKPAHVYPGVAIFLQNTLIFFSSLLYKFGRSEDHWN
jgi:hypothetical protein